MDLHLIQLPSLTIRQCTRILEVPTSSINSLKESLLSAMVHYLREDLVQRYLIDLSVGRQQDW